MDQTGEMTVEDDAIGLSGNESKGIDFSFRIFYRKYKLG